MRVQHNGDLMRRIACIAALLSLAACSTDSTGPGTDLLLEAGEYGGALTVAGGYDPGLYQDRLTNALPDDIKLTAEQQAKIRSLVQDFLASTRADRDALGAIFREAYEAQRAGRTREEIGAILRRGADIRARLFAAEAKLKQDIDAVLTAEQRAWIASHLPQSCRPDRFPALSESQKAQIRAIETAFRENNAADLETIRSVLEEVRVAIQAGKSKDEIAAILQKGAAAAARLATARRVVHDQIVAVLTPEQRASGCFPLG